MLLRSQTVIAATVALLPVTTSAVAHPDSAIPEQWRASIPLAWDHTLTRSELGVGLNLSATQNWALDQIMDGAGTINICMRWGANRTLPEAERQLFESVYKKSVQEWMRWLPGWDNFPFESVNVNVVGWAARSKSQIQGSTGGIEIHTGFNDDQGYPTCNPGCSRELHQDGDFSGCPGGSERRFHQFLLLDPSWGEFNMGAASSAGVSISLHGWETIGSQGKDWPMLVHEIGHSISFPDFLDDFTRPKNRTICSILWIPENAPEKFVMCPGSGGFDMPPALTDMEGWMLRHWWSRFSRLRGWQSDNVTWPAPRNCPQIETRQLGSKGNNQQLRDLH